MKNTTKRLISAVLAVLMLVSASLLLASCETSSEIGNTNDNKAITITISAIKGDNTTDEAVALVQSALNAITEQQYNVHVVLQMFTKAEYQKKITAISRNLEKKFNEIAEAKPNLEDEAVLREIYANNKVVIDENADFDKKANGDIIVRDESGVISTLYPTLAGEQADIILVNGLSMYNDMIKVTSSKDNYLLQLDALISNNIPIVRKYVNAQTLSRVNKASGGTYAIPNNRVYGEYEYMLIDRELFDKYDYDIDSITQASDIDQFVYDVAEKEKDYAPVYNYYGLKWLTFYETDPALLVKPAVNTVDTAVSQYPTNILGYSLFKKVTSMLYNLKKDYGYEYNKTKEVDFDSKWGIAFMSGDSTIPATYSDDYYVVTLQTPFIDNTMYDSMYGLSKYCQYPDRCCDILSLLETDPTFVNILAYGIEGAHYDTDKNGLIVNRSSDWDFDITLAGNNFLLRQNENMTPEELNYSADEWKNGKAQNSKATLSIYAGFELLFDTDQDHIDPETGKQYVDEETGSPISYLLVKDTVDGVNKLSKSTFKSIENFNGSYEDSSGNTIECSMDEYLTYLAGQVGKNKYYLNATLGGSFKRNTTWSPQGQYTAFFLRVYG